jgi:succinoglycan biosynthesis transport protein ExoP
MTEMREVNMNTENQMRSEGDPQGSTGPFNKQIVAVRQKVDAPTASVIDQSLNHRSGGTTGRNPLHNVYLALRGNYIWSIVLGLICGGLCSALAWRLAKPLYHAEGLLKIAYTLPEVLQETDQNRPLAQFDTFLQSQRMIIASHRILDPAIQDPVWQRTKHQVPPNPDQYFAKNMKIEIKPRSEYIQISVTDTDPATAATAVTAVINAYFQYYVGLEKAAQNARNSALDGKESRALSEIDRLQTQAAAESKEYGTTQLDTFYDAAATRIAKLDLALDDIRIPMATAASSADGTLTHPPTTRSSPLTPQQIAVTDPLMQSLLQEQARIEKDLRHFQAQGLGEAHKNIVVAKQDLAEIKERISSQVAFHLEYQAVTAQGLTDPRNGPVVTAGKSLEDLKAMEIKLIELRNKAKQDLIKIGLTRQKLEPIEARLKAVHAEWERVSNRKGVLDTESLGGSRLSVISTAETPLSPDRDLRPIFAGAGGLGGACIPAILMFLRYRLARRVYQYSDETQRDIQSQPPLLGILPALEDLSADSEQAMDVAHSVHQIRVTLRSQSGQGGPSVYLVTSSAAGEGKTSATMSLALSFAASRLRTLVIDGDLIGRRFTENLRATEFQGLHEALAAGSMNRLVRNMATGVAVLPTGKTSARDACGISTQKIRVLLKQARQNYDVVLIDTGPILGSVEAAVLAQEVDSVIFMVGRGQRRSLVEQSLHRLSVLGVPIAGIIFNRAHSSDFSRSAYSSGRLSSAALVTEPPVQPSRPLILTRFGPIVQAVLAGVPISRN